MSGLDGIQAAVLAFGPDRFEEVVGALVREGLPPARIQVVQNPRSAGEAPFDPNVAGVRVRLMPSNGGYAPAMNRALADARDEGADWVLLLTHDVEIMPGALAALAAAAGGARGHGILAPVLEWRTHDGTVYDTTYGSFCDAHGDHGALRAPGPGTATPGIAPCDSADGAALLVRTAMVDEIGALDERFFLYFEETDLCLRAGRSGWAVGCVLGARMRQEGGAARRPGAYAYLYARNVLEVVRRHRGARAALHAARLRLARGMPVRRLLRPSTAREDRRAALATAVGTLAGMLAFALRSWGPPPRCLPGQGDVRGG